MNDEIIYQIDAKVYRVTLFENRLRLEFVDGWGKVRSTQEYYLDRVLAMERRRPKLVRVRFDKGWNYIDIKFKKPDDADLFAHFMNALI